MLLEEFKELKFETVLRSLTDRLYQVRDSEEDFEGGYTQLEIDRCGAILDRYIDDLVACGPKASKARIMRCVETVTKDLNELHAGTNASLIRTEQREYLRGFIYEAAVTAGAPEDDYDIGRQWREW